MTQSTSHTSSLDGSDSSNVTQYTPNTGMYMNQFPWPQPAYIPHQGYAPVHSYYPYGVPPNGMYGTAPPYTPAAPPPGVGPGAAHHALQVGQNSYYPPAAADVSCAAYVGPHSLPTAVGSDPQAHQSHPPAISQQAHLHQPPGAELATGSASTSLSVSNKRAAEECVADDRNPKRHKGGAETPDFEVVLEVEHAALVEPILPPPQVREITLEEVDGDLEFWRWINDIADLPPPQVREVTLAEAGGDIKFWRWINDLADSVDPAPPLCDSPASSSLETLVTEVVENTHPDFGAGNEIEDIVLVEPAPALFQLPEIPLAAVGGDLDLWRWINNIEVIPLSDSPVSPSLENQITEDIEEDTEEDAEDLYSWMSKHDIVIQEPVKDPECWKFHPGRAHPAFLYNVDPFKFD